MEEEFQESEVSFIDRHHFHDQHTNNYRKMVVTSLVNSQFVRNNDNCNNQKSKRKKNNKKNSFPVNIPQSIFRFADSDGFEEDEYYDGGEFVPPHVILGRRIAGKMEFSVCTGNGRTLKGRDLSEVRNSILKLTGFLET